MDPVITFMESDGSISGGTEVDSGNPVAIGEVARGNTGTPTDAQQTYVQVWNDRDGAAASDEAINVSISVVHISGDANHAAFLGTAENGFNSIIEARSAGSIDCSDDAQSSWTPVGPAQLLDIGNIPRQAARFIFLRVRPPSDMDSIDLTEFSVQVNYS